MAAEGVEVGDRGGATRRAREGVAGEIREIREIRRRSDARPCAQTFY